ncbi:hypothetical protein EVAR_103537_1 [Eumeta japonica]|uniref:Uncharacterized protein n=1 Tax=Eumeta variegata TaxID=151549 RepID=A0A4C1YI88_EUMVA|nr:hypothetical protein EVAR_103537_1 [Eumeta japonica]
MTAVRTPNEQSVRPLTWSFTSSVTIIISSMRANIYRVELTPDDRPSDIMMHVRTKALPAWPTPPSIAVPSAPFTIRCSITNQRPKTQRSNLRLHDAPITRRSVVAKRKTCLRRVSVQCTAPGLNYLKVPPANNELRAGAWAQDTQIAVQVFRDVIGLRDTADFFRRLSLTTQCRCADADGPCRARNVENRRGVGFDFSMKMWWETETEKEKAREKGGDINQQQETGTRSTDSVLQDNIGIEDETADGPDSGIKIGTGNMTFIRIGTVISDSEKASSVVIGDA